MAVDPNNTPDPLGNESGSGKRQKELDDIRKAAASASREMATLAKEFANLNKSKLAAQDFDIGLDKFKALNSKIEGLNVNTLKSAKERKAFATSILKAEQEQNANLAKIRTLNDDISDRVKEKTQNESALNDLQKEVRDKAAASLVEQTSLEQKAVEARQAGNEADAVAAEKEAARIKKSSAAEAARDQQRINNAQDLVKESEREISALTGQKNTAIEIVNVQTQQIDKAKQVAAEMERIENAAPGFIDAFAKFGELAAGIPIIGPVFNQITGDIQKSAEMFRDAKAEGKNFFSAIMTGATGFMKLGFFAAMTAFISRVVDGAKISSDAIKTLNKSVAGSTMNMSVQMSRVSAAAGKFTVPLGEAAATIAGINDSLGMQLDFTKETTEQAIKLANKYGVSVDAVAHIVKNSAANKKTMTETVDAVTAGVARFNEMNNVSISTKAIFEDIGKASATTLRGIGKQPGALAAAAAAARSLGMSMEDIRSASEQTTDFQKSLTDEMTTEMMLGKQLNLNKLREAALTGDVTTQAEEMKRLVMENQGRIGNNVKLQEQFAATLGISRDQYNDMLKTQDAMSVLTGKSGAAQEENDKNRKKSNAEIAESVERSVGKLTSLADKLAKMQEGISTGAKGFFDEIVKGFDGLMTDGKFNWNVLWDGMLNAFDVAKKSIIEGIKNIFSGDFSGTDLGKLLGAFTVATGAGFIGLKLLGKGSKFFGIDKLLGTNRPKGNSGDPMYIRNIGAGEGFLGSEGGSKVFKYLFGKKGNFLGNLTRTFNRGITKMFGRNMFSRNLGNLASRINKIKLPNLTNIFSKLKLPKLPNIGKGFMNMLSKFKIPTGAAGGLLKTIGGKVLAPLELLMGGIKGVNQVKDLTAEQKKEQGIKESMGTTEAGIIGALTGNANKGSIFSEKLGIEKGGAGDEALGIATSGLRGAATGAAIGSVIPVVGTAVGAVVGGAIGVVSEGFKVFSDPNSKLRKGLSEFATATYDKAAVIGNKIKETAKEVGNKIKDFAQGVGEKAMEFGAAAKDKIVGFATSVGEGISNFSTSAKEKIGAFATSVGVGIMSFANTAKDKAKAFAGAIGEKVGNIRGKIGEFLEANDGLVGGIRAAASGLASKASKWFGSKVQGLKDWWNNDTSKKATPEIKQEEIKKVTTPLMQMSKDQAKTFTTAINTALSKGADTTIKAMNSLGEVLEEPLMLGAKSANAQMEELKKLKAEGDKQHKAEILELRNQTALLYEYITKPTKSVIKMNTFKVGQSLTRV